VTIVYLLGGPADLTKRVEATTNPADTIVYTMGYPEGGAMKVCRHIYRFAFKLTNGAIVYQFDPDAEVVE
jgi:hypothetical protein